MKYKFNFTFDDNKSINDIFINVLLRELKKYLNNKDNVLLTSLDCSINKGDINYREHK